MGKGWENDGKRLENDGKGWENHPPNEALLQMVDVQAMKLTTGWQGNHIDKNCGGLL